MFASNNGTVPDKIAQNTIKLFTPFSYNLLLNSVYHGKIIINRISANVRHTNNFMNKPFFIESFDCLT